VELIRKRKAISESKALISANPFAPSAGRLERMIRFSATALLGLSLLLGVRCFAQTPPSDGHTLFDTVRTQAIVQISKHATGADMVQVSMEDEGYPADLLRSQIDDLGKRLGTPARGLKLTMHEIASAGQSIGILKCTFAINGLLDHTTGRVALQALAQAFTGDHGKYTVKGMAVLLDGETADDKTVRSFSSPAVEVQGIRINEPRGIEYRILIKTNEPDAIFIPSWSGDKLPPKPVPVPKQGTDWALYSMAMVAALAVGALVYSFLLRPSKSKSKVAPKR
jgi:hypothetical protein